LGTGRVSDRKSFRIVLLSAGVNGFIALGVFEHAACGFFGGKINRLKKDLKTELFILLCHFGEPRLIHGESLRKTGKFCILMFQKRSNNDGGWAFYEGGNNFMVKILLTKLILNLNLSINYDFFDEVLCLIVRGFKDGKQKLEKGIHIH
jgi:hypothetical protein